MTEATNASSQSTASAPARCSLNFTVDDDFKMRFKLYAISQRVSLSTLLRQCFELKTSVDEVVRQLSPPKRG